MTETVGQEVLVATASQVQLRTDAVQAFIMHHVMDSSTLKLPHLAVKLPWFISLHGIMVLLAALVLIVVLGLVGRRKGSGLTRFGHLLEFFVVFIRDKISIPYLGEKDGLIMTPLFCSLFCFILTMNLLGLIPAFYTASANVSVTGALALVTLAFMLVGAMVRNGVGPFFKGFMPHGVPWPVLIILVPIEILGQFIKAFALTIRLFANMLAGHIVLFFMLGLIVIFGATASPFLLMALFIYILEFFIAFLQAYIFTLLSAVFIGQRFHPEH